MALTHVLCTYTILHRMAISGLHDTRTGALFTSVASPSFSFDFSSPHGTTVPRYDGATPPPRFHHGHPGTPRARSTFRLTLVQLVFIDGKFSSFHPLVRRTGGFAPIKISHGRVTRLADLGMAIGRELRLQNQSFWLDHGQRKHTR